MTSLLGGFSFFCDTNEDVLGSKILSHVSDAIITVDIDLVIRSWNKAAENIYGWIAEETIGRSFVDFFIPESLEQIFEHGVVELLEKGSWSYETTQFQKNGEQLAILCYVNTLKHSDGSLAGFVTVNRDITAFRKSEELVQLQTAALNSAIHAILITDRAGCIEWANRAFSKLTEYSLKEVRGKSLCEISSTGDYGADFYNTILSIAKNGNIWQGEIMARRRDASRYHEHLTMAPVRNKNGEITHFISCKEDITERKKAEYELKKQNDVLRKIAWIQAHKVRSPVATILGLSNVFNRSDLADPFNKEVLDRIEKVALQLDQVIREIVKQSNLATVPSSESSVV